jgi:hypothetical protein
MPPIGEPIVPSKGGTKGPTLEGLGREAGDRIEFIFTGTIQRIGDFQLRNTARCRCCILRASRS